MRQLPNFLLLIGLLIACGLLGLVIRGALTSPPSAVEPQEFGIQVTDLAGFRLHLKKPAARIVLLRGRDIHEVLLLLGDEVEDKIVAWGPDIKTADQDSYDVFVEKYPKLKSIPMLGSIYADAINVEQLLALKPDLVVGDTFMVRRGYKSIDRIRAANLPLILTETGRSPLSGPQKSLELLAQAFGKTDRAATINTFIDAQIRQVLDRLPPDARGPTMYMEAGNRGVDQFGHTFGYDGDRQFVTWGAIMNSLRCRNIALDVVPDMTPIHPEHLLKADPEVIVLTGSCWPNVADSMQLGLKCAPHRAQAQLRAFASRPGWSNLQAVRNENLHAIYHNFCSHPTAFYALQQMARWAYPARFAELNPSENLREYYDRFMPVQLSGVQVVSLENEQ